MKHKIEDAHQAAIIAATVLIAACGGVDRSTSPKARVTAVHSLESMLPQNSSLKANSRIVYLDFGAFGHGGLVTTNPDGTGNAVLPLTGVIENWEPVYSADGSRLAQVSVQNLFDIWSEKADGSGGRNVTNQSGDEQDPTWSPSGQMIAYANHPRSFPLINDIWIINADGTGRRNLTNSSASEVAPAWSPAGSKIAFATNADGNWEIYTMNTNGTGQVRLTTNSANDGVSDTQGRRISWSPDGSKIAFASDRDGNWEIYAMNADGSGQTRLTNNASQDTDPRWSPDGLKIAFVSDRVGNLDVYTMNIDGSTVTRVTTDPANQFDADWRPVLAADKAVTVSDAGFAPSDVGIRLGQTVRWDFAGTGNHSVSSALWLGVVGSGREPPGGAYAAAFTFSGTYLVKDEPTGREGRVGVPVTESPKSGTVTTMFTIVWSLNVAPPGVVFDVQISGPGSTTFHDWLTSQTLSSSTFVPNEGPGTYRFRSRVRSTVTGRTTGYSPANRITVS